MIDDEFLVCEECESAPELAKSTDTEIVLNFQRAITDLYPRLIPISAYCYDAWDEIVERLFCAMTDDVVAWKYGVSVPWAHHHKYGLSTAIDESTTSSAHQCDSPCS